MLIVQISLSAVLFFIGVFGIITHRRNVIILLMCLELMLLSVNINFILFSIYLDDLTGQIWAIFILTVAASEAAVGLAILIGYYSQRGNVIISEKELLKF